VLGKHVAGAAAGFPISGGFRGLVGIPKSKSTVHGDCRGVSDPPQVAGHSLGGGAGSFRKFPEIAGNCRSGRCSRVGQVLQSWAVWCSLLASRAPITSERRWRHLAACGGAAGRWNHRRGSWRVRRPVASRGVRRHMRGHLRVERTGASGAGRAGTRPRRGCGRGRGVRGNAHAPTAALHARAATCNAHAPPGR